MNNSFFFQCLAMLALFMLAGFCMMAQVPSAMMVQTVIRNEKNELLANTAIGMKVSVLKGSPEGNVVYSETHDVVTDQNGLVKLVVGTGVPGLKQVGWADDSHYIQSEADINGDAAYELVGVSQLIALPYAMHAGTAKDLAGSIMESDPVFEASVAGGITISEINSWNNKQNALAAGRGISINGNHIQLNADDFREKSCEGPAWPECRLRGANIVTRITKEDIDFFAQNWQGNSVRILVNNLAPAPPAKPDAQKLEAVYRTIDMSLDAGLYTILSFSPSFEDNDAFFSSEEYMDSYIEVWKEIVTRYASDQRGVAWDLMNEPHDQLANTHWQPYAERLVSAIREIDTIHTIVVEPPGWGWPYGFEHLKPIDDDNIVYSFHFYGPMDFTHQRNNGMLKATDEQWLARKYPGHIQGEYWDKSTIRRQIQPAFNWAKKHNVKMWCGEFGCTRWAVGADQWIQDIISILEEEEVGWSWYAYREWYPMDIEMDAEARLERTERSETSLVKFFKKFFYKKD